MRQRLREPMKARRGSLAKSRSDNTPVARTGVQPCGAGTGVGGSSDPLHKLPVARLAAGADRRELLAAADGDLPLRRVGWRLPGAIRVAVELVPTRLRAGLACPEPRPDLSSGRHRDLLLERMPRRPDEGGLALRGGPSNVGPRREYDGWPTTPTPPACGKEICRTPVRPRERASYFR